jgi:putative SOS response-associated peptidase YedK
MCGRYMITSSFEAMARLFEAELEFGGNVIGDAARPNVSPTEAIPVVVAGNVDGGGGRRVVAMRWGLVPPWYKTATGGPLLINARAEGVATKPAFAKAVRERRCLIPADGFYEWTGEKGAKTPFVIRRPDGGPFAFAGLWESWRGQPTAAIVTCAANATLAPIHERMPVVLAPADYALWLGEAGHGAARLMVPAPEEALVASPAAEETRAHLLTPDRVAAVL